MGILTVPGLEMGTADRRALPEPPFPEAMPGVIHAKEGEGDGLPYPGKGSGSYCSTVLQSGLLKNQVPLLLMRAWAV